MSRMNITLALSGGGVKGFAHIGVLRVLEREGYRIQGVAGSSAGGLVGALYALGYSADEMEERLRDIDQGSLFARLHGDEPSLLGFSGVAALLESLLGKHTFDDLRVPLAVTATDLKTGMPVILKQGLLMDAVLATSAIPGVFPARSIDGHVYADGGIMNPIPVAAARALYTDAPVIAVVLSPPLGWQAQGTQGSVSDFPLLMTNLPLVYRLAGRLRLAKAFNIFIHAMDLTGLMLMDKQLALEKPDVIIRPLVGQIGIVDRVDIPSVIKTGELAAQEALPEIHKLMRWNKRFSRWLTQMRNPV